MKKPIDFARSILNNKTQEEILPCDDFLPFLIQRYISIASPAHCVLINDILNVKAKNWNDHQEIYNYLKCIIPKQNIRYFQYIWKKKELDNIDDIDVSTIAESLEMSKREVIEYFKMFPELKEEYKNTHEKILKRNK